MYSVGVKYSGNPTKIYTILATRNTENDAATVAALVKELDSNYKPNGGVTAAYRESYTSAIKGASPK